MAERSKALDSSSSLSGGVGSNPTPSITLFFLFNILVRDKIYTTKRGQTKRGALV